jgi:hypothetical protein
MVALSDHIILYRPARLISTGKVKQNARAGTYRRRSANRRGERTQRRLGRINQEARKPGK